MNFDRGFIKWAPFNSVISSKSILKKMDTIKISKPILSKDQLEELNELIMVAFYSQNTIKISFYEQNQIKNLITTITKINSPNNTIHLANGKTLIFNQILNIQNI